MNKQIFKAGLLASLLIPGSAMAQDVFSSNLDASIRFGIGANTEPDTEISLQNFGSRIRWAASADVDENIQIVSYLELGVDQDEGISGTRQAWIGATGNFGTITGGKQYTAFYDAVTSKVDIAYWISCVLPEIGCNRQASVLKYASNETNGMQFIASTTMTESEQLGDDQVIDGLDLAAKFDTGTIELAAGISYLGERFFVENNNLFKVDDGFAAGLSAAVDINGGQASITAQFASNEYSTTKDNVAGLTATYSAGNIYGLIGMADYEDTKVFLTGGYVKPIIADRALLYFEGGLYDQDIPGESADFNARAVLVFNFGKHTAS